MDVSNLIEVKGIRSEGYGIVAKAPMRDKRLTAEAKAIYAYLCSYTGAGSRAFPPLALMLEELGMAPKRYYKHLRHLTAYGYVKVHTRYKAAGKSRETNVYEIVDMPEVDVAELAKLARAKATDGEAPEAPGDATEGMGPGAGSIVENSQNPRSADIGHFDQHQIVENSDDRQNPRSVDIGRFEQVQIEQVQNDQTIINNQYNYQSIDPAAPQHDAGENPFAQLCRMSLKPPASSTLALARREWEGKLCDGLTPEAILDAYRAYRTRYKASNPSTTRYAKQLHDWLSSPDGLAFDLIGSEEDAAGADELTAEELRALRTASEDERERALAKVDPSYAELLRLNREAPTEQERVAAFSKATVYAGRPSSRKAAARRILRDRARAARRASQDGCGAAR